MAYDTVTRTFTGQAAQGITCWCSVEFAIPKSLYAYYRERNDERPGSYPLHCPLGHTMIPAGQSAADRLRDELAREKHWREQAEARSADLAKQRDHIEYKRRGTLGALRKVQKRVKHGVCPCCHRTFQNVARHMESKHPHFGAAAEAET